MKIIFTGGGSGGHIFPLLAVADFLVAKQGYRKAQLHFIGGYGMEKDIIPRRGYRLHRVCSGKLRRYFSLQNFIDPIFVLIGIFQSLFLLWKIKPAVVFSKGGFVSIPTGIAAWILRIPLVIHESDSRPGLANRILGKLARHICVGFQESLASFPKSKTTFTGNLIPLDFSKAKKLKTHKLDPKRKTILITGGSQGARTLNQLVFSNILELTKKYQLIHQCGKHDIEQAQLLKSDYYHPLEFIEQMRDTIYSADLVISRSGAQNLTEIAYFGKPSILFPLPHVSDQRKNALIFQKQGASIILSERVSDQKLLSTIKSSFQKSQTMSKNASSLSSKNALRDVSRIILKFT